jgi:hypothetical protein
LYTPASIDIPSDFPENSVSGGCTAQVPAKGVPADNGKGKSMAINDDFNIRLGFIHDSNILSIDAWVPRRSAARQSTRWNR